MTWHVVHLKDAAPSPWKNGGGITRELVAWPKAADWLWRMSVADVTQSGPFSRFDGIERWFAVLEGDGVALSTDGKRYLLTEDSAPLRFDGSSATGCELLGGPTRDFNLMTRHGAATATMTRVKGLLALPVNATEIIAIYSIPAGTSVLFDADPFVQKAHSLVWQLAECDAVLDVVAEQALVIRVALTSAVLNVHANPAKEAT